jgi:predicted HTH domain antitoxin
MPDTARIVVQVPPALAEELAAASQEYLANLLRRGLQQERIERAIARYQQGLLSFAAAAEEADISQGELARQAYVRGLEPPDDPDLLAEELQ